MRLKHIKNGAFFNHKPLRNTSIVWKRICSTRTTVTKGACYKLGNGQLVNPWRDPWIPWIPGHVPKLQDGVNGDFWNCVAYIKTTDGLEWNSDLLHQICEPDSCQAILKLS